MTTILVALAVGHGTGTELTAIFKEVIQTLAASYNLTITFTQSPRTYHSYSSLLAINDTDAVTQETLIDAAHYRQFCIEAAHLGAAAIFRTSISAQALYMVREDLLSVKVEHFTLSPTASILLIRDQAQGFYSGQNVTSEDSVTRTSVFSKTIFEQILTFALLRARQVWGPSHPISTVTMVYKFHLFDGLFASWARSWESSFKLRIHFVQGDTMNRNILAYGLHGHNIIISANEYADIMQTIFLDRFGLGAQESACAENVYLHLQPETGGLSEYQTAHGSADDLEGRGVVNPSATMRAAAALLGDQHGGACPGVKERVDGVLHKLKAEGIATLDQGGVATTEEFTRAFLQALTTTTPTDVGSEGGSEGGSDGESSVSIDTPRSSVQKSCLVVVDFQNDFFGTDIALKNRPALERVKGNIPLVINWARREGLEVIFLRFLGDEQFQGPSWRNRDATQGRSPWCIAGSLGAEIVASVQVQDHERVFDKKAKFDPFLSLDFERYVSDSQFEQLVVVGVFADICVDATVRGAFQRGLGTMVVRECTVGLHYPEEQILGFMEEVYGSGVIAIDDLLSLGLVANNKVGMA